MIERVKALVERLAPAAVCEGCISDRLDQITPKQAHETALELAGAAGFERQIGECAICGKTKKVIRRKSH